MLYPEFLRGFGETCFFTEQDNLDIWKQSAGFDRVALNRCDVRISEGFGGGEKRNERHLYLSPVRAGIYVLEGFMFDVRIDLRELRFIVDQIQDFFPCKIVATIEATVDLTHEFQIFRRIHGPALIAKISGVIQESNSKSAR